MYSYCKIIPWICLSHFNFITSTIVERLVELYIFHVFLLMIWISCYIFLSLLNEVPNKVPNRVPKCLRDQVLKCLECPSASIALSGRVPKFPSSTGVPWAPQMFEFLESPSLSVIQFVRQPVIKLIYSAGSLG